MYRAARRGREGGAFKHGIATVPFVRSPATVASRTPAGAWTRSYARDPRSPRGSERGSSAVVFSQPAPGFRAVGEIGEIGSRLLGIARPSLDAFAVSALLLCLRPGAQGGG